MPFRGEPLTFDGNAYLPLAGGTMTGSILVSPDNAIDLGQPAARWRAVYAYTLDLKTGIVGSANLTSTFNAPTVAGDPGFTYVEVGGAGAAGVGATPGGAGGTRSIKAGRGGAGTAGAVSGAGGNFEVDAGDAGADGGAGVGAAGLVNIGRTNARGVKIGRAATETQIDGTLRYDNVIGVAGASAGYLVINVAGVTKKVQYFDEM